MSAKPRRKPFVTYAVLLMNGITWFVDPSRRRCQLVRSAYLNTMHAPKMWAKHIRVVRLEEQP